MRDTKRTRGSAPGWQRGETYNEIKATWEAVIVEWAKAARLPRVRPMVTLHCVWYEETTKRDPDGIAAGGRKILIDALVKAGVFDHDRHGQFFGFTDSYRFKRGEGVALHWSADAGEAGDLGRFPHRLPDLNELLAARELGARRSQHGKGPR